MWKISLPNEMTVPFVTKSQNVVPPPVVNGSSLRFDDLTIDLMSHHRQKTTLFVLSALR